MLTDRELDRYYQALFGMFSSEGWKELMKDVENQRTVRADVRTATPETLRFVQGELASIDWLLNLPTTTEFAYNEMLHVDSDEESSGITEGGRAEVLP